MLPIFPWKAVPCQASFPSPEVRADPQKGLGTKLTIQIQMLYIHSSDSADSNIDLEYWEAKIKMSKSRCYFAWFLLQTY